MKVLSHACVELMMKHDVPRPKYALGKKHQTKKDDFLGFRKTLS